MICLVLWSRPEEQWSRRESVFVICDFSFCWNIGLHFNAHNSRSFGTQITLLRFLTSGWRLFIGHQFFQLKRYIGTRSRDDWQSNEINSMASHRWQSNLHVFFFNFRQVLCVCFLRNYLSLFERAISNKHSKFVYGRVLNDGAYRCNHGSICNWSGRSIGMVVAAILGVWRERHIGKFNGHYFARNFKSRTAAKNSRCWLDLQIRVGS